MRPILGRLRRAPLSSGPGPKSSACAWRRCEWGAALGREHVLSSPPVKLFTAGVATESNTFSPIRTGLDDYAIFRGPVGDRASASGPTR
jgi:hypothetical protein